MSLLGKTRAGTRVATPSAAGAPPTAVPRNLRVSNGLKDFLWLLDGVEHGALLDLGTVWQSTVSLFVERGFKVYTEDLLRDWKEFRDEYERRRQEAVLRGEPEAAVADFGALAEAFLDSILRHPPETFNAVLAWDVFDYLPPEVGTRLAARLNELLRPGGVVLALFHSRLPQSFSRYRVLDPQTVEVLPAPPLLAPVRLFQNRELLNLFAGFRSSKTFVGRDQIREGLFTK